MNQNTMLTMRTMQDRCPAFSDNLAAAPSLCRAGKYCQLSTNLPAVWPRFYGCGIQPPTEPRRVFGGYGPSARFKVFRIERDGTQETLGDLLGEHTDLESAMRPAAQQLP